MNPRGVVLYLYGYVERVACRLIAPGYVLIGYIGLRADPDNNFTSTDPTVTAYNTTIGVTTTVTTTTTATKTIANTTIT